MNADQDPYFIHYYRINLDGTGLVALTEGNGNHTVQFSPDRKFIIDTYSRVDMAPIHELRRCSDGKLVCKLEEADITELKDSGWEAPEVFTAKGRDGKTDIWGVIRRPKNLDPTQKYPILENIYNGPQGAYVPKSFSAGNRSSGMAEAGFILVQCDAMGTAFRSKAFHDVCWHNLSDAGLPDRIAWIKAAAEKYPYMDINRVGIFGTSAGGQNAAAAVIFHPEFYKCAVANSGCHDNRLDKASWNEQWMGYLSPDKIWSKDSDNWYAQNSNIDNAAKLRGKLFLIEGEMDDNVPPESTMRFVDALIKAKKDFDFLVVPGANHGAASPVTQRRTLDFFVHNLQGKEPPDRNAESVAAD
jgi:dipeptidyl aminopeptidase/acylaminoacyl peptidase